VKNKYEILKGGFGLIYIKDKPYYYVVDKGFCIVEFDEWNFIDNNYIKINYDPITGEKLITDNELKQFIKFEKKQIAKRKAQIKYMNTYRDMKDKEYKQSLIDEFGKEEADIILSKDNTPHIISSSLFNNCTSFNKPIQLNDYDSGRSLYIEKLREERLKHK
jgi:hypothetical protein